MILTRNQTLELTKNLSQKKLDYNIDEKSNSINTYLTVTHNSIRIRFPVKNIYFRDFSNIEFKKYENALSGNMIHRKIKGIDIIMS